MKCSPFPSLQNTAIILTLIALLFLTEVGMKLMAPARQQEKNTPVITLTDKAESKDEKENKTEKGTAAALIPHRALYEIKMISQTSGSQVINISGEMSFEWEPTCEAWNAQHKFNLLYEYTDIAPMYITSDFSTYELFDGARFVFNARRKRNDTIYQELRGLAEMPPNGKGLVTHTIPADMSYDLPEGTLFPMAHTIAVLKKAAAGEHFFNAPVFDGSDEEGPVEINAFIKAAGSPPALPKESDSIDATLLTGPAWDVRMAFFPLNNTEAESEYEMNIRLHQNGIISDMLVEYDDFSVTQKLIALESLPVPLCEE